MRKSARFDHVIGNKGLWRAFGLIVIGIVAGWYLGNRHVAKAENSTPSVNVIRENSNAYRFINPILLVDNSGVVFNEYAPLDKEITDLVSKETASGAADKISVYFRDINTGKWTGTNETELYSPASMLKVITLLAYLKMAEANPDFLNEKMEYVPVDDPGQFYKPEHPMVAGSYSIRDIMLQMIIESDNQAMKILNDAHPDAILSVYKELELPDPNTPADDFMSAEMYSRIFRTLYSSTYLSREYSEQALELLSYTSFDQGLVQGTGTTQVSHKFGEHTVLNSNGTPAYRELHDCGIVYVPGHPYFLCVMTKGQNFAELQKVIGDISTLVYKEQE
ncbi:MAG: hypothetical protein JWN50_462 [Parcubacteria group bacterium]|nr:hypothetical protein [Parcubacteria group bacterium]